MQKRLILILFLFSIPARAATDSWHSGIQGDPRSVGRGGTGIVLSDDLWGVFENPAGSAMIVGGTTLQVSGNSIEDNQLVPTQSMKTHSAGVVAPETPWGFAVGGYSVDQVELVNEYSISASRLYDNDHVALGAAINVGQTATDTALGTTIGGLYRFPKRWIIGGSYRTPMTYNRPTGGSFQHPGEWGLGIGHIPNRFFRTEFGLRLIQRSVSSDPWLNVSPHFGMEYQFVSLKQIQVRAYAGTYYDLNRPHGTFGFGIDPWIFSIGMAADFASGYKNYLFGFGVDIGRTLKKLRLIPSGVQAPSGGLFPKPTEVNDDWLNERLQDDPDNSFHEIGSSIDRIKRRVENFGDVIKQESKALKEEGDSTKEDWEEIKNSF